ncbi:RICIN domain-containing protein [Actinoplanes sp. NBRC 101535]|uniref:RICIN domain-containing protein n=1 Tax=Actinoplanes sp. NBRC 101535 TaxID=3032196 RepID=UPI0024A234F4|nr:RICIN domain-containing protein [Actinoplanes sp. NBRC 101535]GLY00716.1 hypothetical protein Acsp01_10950 [Actinoplanes sp. NBRC 101535]
MIDFELIVPDGWAEVPVTPASAGDRPRLIDGLVRAALPADLPEDKAATWQKALRREVTAAADEAARNQARTVLLPVPGFDGTRLPGSLFVSVVENVEENTAPEQLFASVLAGAGDDGSYLEIAGAQAIRVATTAGAERSQQVRYYIAHPSVAGAYGLVTFTVAGGDEAEVTVQMFDAVVGTLRWEEPEPEPPVLERAERAERAEEPEKPEEPAEDEPTTVLAAEPATTVIAEPSTEIVVAPLTAVVPAAQPTTPAPRRNLRRPIALGVVLALAALTGAGGFAARQAASAAEPLEGNRLSASDVRILVDASSSCTALTPPRLAGQVMIASNFGSQPVEGMRTGGAAGVAALTPAQWQQNVPWEGAQITDREASVTALAHHMCGLIGQSRAVAIAEDPWRVALAAHRLGMDQVLVAGGIPGEAQNYVDTAERYANWYALQPAFAGGPASPSPTVTPVSADTVPPVPDAYLKAVVTGGKSCPEMPPARLAAQLMASSGFDADKLGPAGEQGIAQFPPQVWVDNVKASATRSPWDPAVAIPALGRTMCKLIKQTGGYPAALAAFTRGDKAAPVTELAATVTKAQTEYAKDTRLQPAKAPSKAPSVSVSPSVSGSAKPAKSSAAPKPAAPQGRANQPAIMATDANGSDYGPYFIHNLATGMCVDIGGYGPGAADGPVTQFPCAKTTEDNQEWHFVPRIVDGDGYQLYWIRNADDGLCLDVPGADGVDSGTAVSETNCFDNDNQYFRLEKRTTSGGFEYYWLRNTTTWMCLDVPGVGEAGADARLALVPCAPNDDHDWALIEKSEW